MDRLVLDVMCGKLATYLRMCGYDAAYALDLPIGSDRDVPDDALLAFARETGRRIVTRDRDLARRGEDAVLLESKEIAGQLRELVEAGFDLTIDEEPSFCGACNGALTGVGPEEPTPDYAPDPATVDVWRCADCGQHFWKGSHWDDVVETVQTL
jgi:uncharacterized protein with PIN domain